MPLPLTLPTGPRLWGERDAHATAPVERLKTSPARPAQASAYEAATVQAVPPESAAQAALSQAQPTYLYIANQRVLRSEAQPERVWLDIQA